MGLLSRREADVSMAERGGVGGGRAGGGGVGRGGLGGGGWGGDEWGWGGGGGRGGGGAGGRCSGELGRELGGEAADGGGVLAGPAAERVDYAAAGTGFRG